MIIYVYIHILFGRVVKKLDKIRNELRSRVSSVVAEHILRRELSALRDQYRLGEKSRRRLLNEPRKVSLKWSHRPLLTVRSYKTTFDTLELVQAFCNSLSRCYVSHYTALYWNELVGQKPKDYYLTREISSRNPQHTKDYDQDRIRQAFLKTPRHTSQYAAYRGTKLYLVEKQDLGEIGVTTKDIQLKTHSIQLRLTNIERTLIDAVISPHYSGGILTVINAYAKAKINTRDLYDIYQRYNPYYPYWQSIGLILENVKGAQFASDWKSYFDTRTFVDFYIDRQVRSDWNYSEQWKVYYPMGAFHDSY